MEYQYKLRNLPCNIVADDKLWCVSGGYTYPDGTSGGGVLEWCYDKNDALSILTQIRRDNRYYGLRIHAWEE